MRKKKKTWEVIFEKLSFNEGAMLVREEKKKKKSRRKKNQGAALVQEKKKFVAILCFVCTIIICLQY